MDRYSSTCSIGDNPIIRTAKTYLPCIHDKNPVKRNVEIDLRSKLIEEIEKASRLYYTIVYRVSKNMDEPTKLFPFFRAGLQCLDSLGLAHNRLREVPARVFSHMTQLNSLELDGNQITHVDPNAFIGLEGKHT